MRATDRLGFVKRRLAFIRAAVMPRASKSASVRFSERFSITIQPISSASMKLAAGRRVNTYQNKT